MSGRPCAANIESTDPMRFKATADHRRDYRTGGKFTRRLMRFMNGNQDVGKRLAALSLRSVNGFTFEMIGLVFGRNARLARDMVRQAESELPPELASHFDYRTDTYTAISAVDAETILKRAPLMRKFLADDDTEFDNAIDELRIALAERLADE